MTLVLESTVKLSILLLAGLGVVTLLRARAASLRHWVLATAIGAAAVAPALGAFAPSWGANLTRTRSAVEPSAASAPSSTAAATVTFETRTAPAATPIPPPSSKSLSASLVMLWLIGAVASVMVLAVGVARLMWLGARADVVRGSPWNRLLTDVARELEVTSPVTLLATDHPALLVTWGLLTPKVLIPRTALAWSEDRVRVVLRHELSHIRRRDWLVQMVAEIVRAIHWFNPLAWIACRRVREESEHACDDTVLRLGVDGSEYASHLLDLARSMGTRQRTWVPAQAMVRPSSLERRVTAMLNARLDRAPVSWRSRLVATTAMFALALAVAGFAASAQTTATVTGTITDQLGGYLPNAPIVMTDLTTNEKHSKNTDRNGRYAFDGLMPGDYMLAVAGIPGFQDVQRRIVLTGGPSTQNVKLQIGRIQETIRVTDGPPVAYSQGQAGEHKLRPVGTPCVGDCMGGNIGMPLKLHDVKPVFPASQAGNEGVVNLRGVIDTTGHVIKLQVVGDANPDFAQAAIDAVSKWEFDPTRLNGVIVETEMNVAISFAAAR